MNSYPRILLRYFDARGRAQFIRYYLRARDIPHEDQRVPLSPEFEEWSAIRDDIDLSGPFKKLPVLHYGDQMVAEALVITYFLHQHSGDAKILSPEENLHHQMLISSLYMDVMTHISLLIWADILYKKVDVPILAVATLDRLRRHFEVLNTTLDRWQWLKHLDYRGLMLADCCLWDQLTSAGDIFGRHLQLEKYKTLNQFHQACPGRDKFHELLLSHPSQITGRPGEKQILKQIMDYLDKAAKLKKHN